MFPTGTHIITLLDPSALSPADLDGYAEVQLAALRVDQPADEAPTRESATAWLTAAVPDTRRVTHWVARDGGRVVGFAMLMLLTDSNPKLAFLGGTVHPGFRRRGPGTELLRAAVPHIAWRPVSARPGRHSGRNFVHWAM